MEAAGGNRGVIFLLGNFLCGAGAGRNELELVCGPDDALELFPVDDTVNLVPVVEPIFHPGFCADFLMDLDGVGEAAAVEPDEICLWSDPDEPGIPAVGAGGRLRARDGSKGEPDVAGGCVSVQHAGRVVPEPGGAEHGDEAGAGEDRGEHYGFLVPLECAWEFNQRSGWRIFREDAVVAVVRVDIRGAVLCGGDFVGLGSAAEENDGRRDLSRR